MGARWFWEDYNLQCQSTQVICWDLRKHNRRWWALMAQRLDCPRSGPGQVWGIFSGPGPGPGPHWTRFTRSGPGPDSDLVLDSNIFHFFLNIRTKDKLALWYIIYLTDRSNEAWVCATQQISRPLSWAVQSILKLSAVIEAEVGVVMYPLSLSSRCLYCGNNTPS